MKTKLIDIKKIKKSGIRNEQLPDGFIARVQEYKEILKEVETSSLEETITNFQRDLFPESELLLWENIASLYQAQIRENPNSALEQKKQIFRDIFSNFV